MTNARGVTPPRSTTRIASSSLYAQKQQYDPAFDLVQPLTLLCNLISKYYQYFLHSLTIQPRDPAPLFLAMPQPTTIFGQNKSRRPNKTTIMIDGLICTYIHMYLDIIQHPMSRLQGANPACADLASPHFIPRAPGVGLGDKIKCNTPQVTYAI